MPAFKITREHSSKLGTYEEKVITAENQDDAEDQAWQWAIESVVSTASEINPDETFSSLKAGC